MEQVQVNFDCLRVPMGSVVSPELIALKNTTEEDYGNERI